MGGIKIISPVPNLLCTKAIPAMMGEMKIFFSLSKNKIAGLSEFSKRLLTFAHENDH